MKRKFDLPMIYVYEFIGTFFLMLTIALTVYGQKDSGLLAPLAIGSILAVMVYAGGHISGAHYNPAVSLAAYLRGRIDGKNFWLYILSQFLGAAFAAAIAIYLQGQAAKDVLEVDLGRAFVSEFLFTFALCHVVLNTAMSSAVKGNSFFGFAIGFVVLAGAFAVGRISGAAFNPAVAFGQAIVNLTAWSNLWVYILATFLGGAASAGLLKLGNGLTEDIVSKK